MILFKKWVEFFVRFILNWFWRPALSQERPSVSQAGGFKYGESPLVPAHVILHQYQWIPFNIARFLDSEFVAVARGDAFKAGVTLMCKSWHQEPAASLPNNDALLEHLSGAYSQWAKVKHAALTGWVLSPDGRYYHPAIAEQALIAWEKHAKYIADKQGDVERKRVERNDRARIFELARSVGEVLPITTTTAQLRQAEPRLKEKLRNMEYSSHANVTAKTAEDQTRHNRTDIKDISSDPLSSGMPFDPSTVELPIWLPKADWEKWCAHRRENKKALTPTAAVEQLSKLSEYRESGHDPVEVIARSIASGWQSLFPPAPMKTTNAMKVSSALPQAVRGALSLMEQAEACESVTAGDWHA